MDNEQRKTLPKEREARETKERNKQTRRQRNEKKHGKSQRMTDVFRFVSTVACSSGFQWKIAPCAETAY